MSIILPAKFNKIINKNNKIKAGIYGALSVFSDWLYDNKTEFFPEYTDHGERHIQDVLNTSSEIITKDSYELLTSEDVYVLVSSILLHDCAMHISKSGLCELLTNDIYNSSMFGFGKEQAWNSKWLKFCDDVKKFDGSTCISFFGKFNCKCNTSRLTFQLR